MPPPPPPPPLPTSSRSCFFYLLFFSFIIQLCRCQFLRVPPKVEGPPRLLDSFLPAGMQIMAHLTELMKYETKPTQKPPTNPAWTTTQRPTSSHKPAIYQPEVPPGPEAYFARGATYQEYIKRLQNPSGPNYFDRYTFSLTEPVSLSTRSSSGRSLSFPLSNLEYFGENFARLYEMANTIEDISYDDDLDSQVQEFSQNYDDSDFRFELLRQKKVPPTKAYVTLLSLYDLLNKESKSLGLNKYGGYTDQVLQALAESSTGTSAYQLRFVLNKIFQRQDTKKLDILNRIQKLIDDLDQDNSYINDAIRYIPPLSFAF